MSVRSLLVVALPLVFGGCFLMSSSKRPGPEVSGSALYVERCETCHVTAAQSYAGSLHAGMGIRCGQCHAPDHHPDFTQPVRDATCGGCHVPQLEQTLESAHFATRARAALDGDRAARATLRRDGFTVALNGKRTFAGEATSELGGRLCAACHYDEHRLGLRAVQRADFCVGCHAGREAHFPVGAVDAANRCVLCHVRVGDTVTGQPVNTHRFAR